MIPQHLLEVEKTIEFKAVDVEKHKNERAITHYISTPDLDRVRDVLDPKGMDDSEFNLAPSVWYNHNYKYDPNAKPIAKSLWRKKKDEGVLTKTEFATLAFADDIYQLHTGGFISTWSVGISPVKDKNGNQKQGSIRFDEKNNKTYWDFWRLLEYSSAPMAANIYAQDVVKNLKELELKSQEMQDVVCRLEFKSEIVKMIQDQDVKLEQIAKKELELKTLLDAQLLQDLEKSEREILELRGELNLLKDKLTKPSGESVVKLTSADLQDAIKLAVDGALSRITGKN